MNIEVSQRIEAPAEQVWAVITDLANSPQVISGIDAVEILGGPPEFGVGTRWRETRTMLGKTATEEMEVSAVDPGSLVLRCRGEPRRALRLDADGGAGWRVRVHAHDDVPWRADQHRGPDHGCDRRAPLLGASRKALAKDLPDIAAAVEARQA